MHLVNRRLLQNRPKAKNPDRPLRIIEHLPGQCADELDRDPRIVLFRGDDGDRDIDRRFRPRGICCVKRRKAYSSRSGRGCYVDVLDLAQPYKCWPRSRLSRNPRSCGKSQRFLASLGEQPIDLRERLVEDWLLDLLVDADNAPASRSAHLPSNCPQLSIVEKARVLPAARRFERHGLHRSVQRKVLCSDFRLSRRSRPQRLSTLMPSRSASAIHAVCSSFRAMASSTSGVVLDADRPLPCRSARSSCAKSATASLVFFHAWKAINSCHSASSSAALPAWTGRQNHAAAACNSRRDPRDKIRSARIALRLCVALCGRNIVLSRPRLVWVEPSCSRPRLWAPGGIVVPVPEGSEAKALALSPRDRLPIADALFLPPPRRSCRSQAGSSVG